MRYSLSGLALAAVLVAGCSGSSAVPSAAPTAEPVATAEPAATAEPVATAEPTPSPPAERDWEGDIEAAIASGDCAALESVTTEAFLAGAVDGLSGETLTAYITATASCEENGTTSAPVAEATPEPTAEPTAKPTPKPTPIAYKKLSARQWKLLVKAPDRYTGKAYQVWACIWQFDAATGEDAFLGNGSHKKQTYWNLYGENASFTGNASRLESFVEGDVVVMNVISTGSYSYDTQAGGNTTVPSFEIKKIARKGSCD